ncbi:MAG: hypothetical protein AB1Z65_02715 [Candidatus Sulfomarinibacteraceae bacterium]
MTVDTRIRILTIAAVTLVLMPGLAAAADQDTGKAKAWYERETTQQKLELTNDQIARIAEVENDFGPRLAEMNQEKRTAYRALITALDAGELPQAEFEAMRNRLESAYGSHAALTGERWRALRSILTKTQWRNLPEAAPKALSLGQFGVSKRGGFYMGPGAKKTAPNPK